MYLSIYRRGVILPLDNEALEACELVALTSESNIRRLGIETDDEFSDLWRSGIFQAINQATGCMIDDYEEEAVQDTDLAMVIDVANRFVQMPSKVTNDFALNFVELCSEALQLGMPVYFVF